MSLGSSTHNVLVIPAVTGAMLWALTKSPEEYRNRLLQALGSFVDDVTISRGINMLKWLCALSLLRNVHTWLSDIAQNNFRLRSERSRYDWPKEIAVVTGAASGFGALIAKDLAAQGLNVMAVDIKDSAPDDIKANPRIHYYQCDITDREKVMELAARIRTQYGDPSILVNNAGVAFQHTILTATEKSLNSTFNVNVISHYWTLQAFLPAMIANKKGHVVSMASIASFLSGSGMVPYSGTKAALVALHEGLQSEVRSIYKAPEVKFTIIHPTFANTALVAPFKQELTKRKVFIMEPQDVSNAVVRQVLSCTGRQIILGDVTWIAGIRAWPHWLSQAIFQLMDGGDSQDLDGPERSSSMPAKPAVP